MSLASETKASRFWLGAALFALLLVLLAIGFRLWAPGPWTELLNAFSLFLVGIGVSVRWLRGNCAWWGNAVVAMMLIYLIVAALRAFMPAR
jgi:hypothetical protein